MTIQNLHNLIHQLTSHEQMLVRYALKGPKEEGGNKSRQLFDFIVTCEKNVSRGEASVAIYNSPPDTRINKLVTRSWEKILDIITSDNFLRKNTRFNEQSLKWINARKKMVQYLTLRLLNGISDVSHVLVGQGIEYAEESDYFSLLIDLYKQKKNMAVFINTNKEYVFFEKQIEWYTSCLLISEKLLNYHNELIKEQGYGNRDSPVEKVKYLEKILRELKKNKKYIVSVYSKYIYVFIQLDYLFHKENYSGARKLLYKLLRDFGNSPLPSGIPIATRVESGLSDCELLTGNYTKGIIHSERALAMLRANKKSNYFIELEKIFLCVFFSGDLVRAEKLVDELQTNSQLLLNNFRIAKPGYYRACIHFKRGEYNAVLKIINSPLPLNNDKTGYDIAIRVLRIQCLVELNRLDEATMQIENLRKHISRNHKKTYTSERDKLITRTLMRMQKRGFSGKPGKVESELVAKLSLPSGKYKWSPVTPELIRFHEWHKETGIKK